MPKKTGSLFFLLGLGTYTKVFLFGCISITELICFLVAPIIFIKNYKNLRKDGYLKFLLLVVLSMIGGVVGTIVADNGLFMLRNHLARLYAIFSIIVVFHAILSRNMMGFKWFFVGVCLSSIVSIFILNPEAHVSEVGVWIEQATTEAVMEGNMFWMQRLHALMDVFISGLYFETPMPMLLIFPIIYVLVLVSTTETGRAASAMTFIGWCLILIAGKRLSRMKNVSKYFPMLIAIGILMIPLMKGVYIMAARSGLLTEKATQKFENQTKEGSGFMQILMKGRVHFFIGLRACIDNPILGYGCYPLDKEGYRESFYAKYGDDSYYASRARYIRAYGRPRVELIPAHSYLIGAWVNYGIFGLLMWAYVLFLCVNHLRKAVSSIPQWYGLFALYIPTLMWDIFFSPFTERVIAPMVICCLLFARAVERGVVRIPHKMIIDSMSLDR